MRFTTDTGYTNSARAGAMAVLLGSSVWGLFWIPLRYLDTLGVGGLWALTFAMATGFVPALVMTVRRKEFPDLVLSDTWYAGLALGLAMTLYFVALLYTDVIRVIFLFYLLPVWTTISAWMIYREPVSLGRIGIMLIALFGLWLLLGGGSGLPVPQSLGDWCAIASGLCWGVSLSLLRGRERGGAFSRTLVAISSALVFSLLTALLLSGVESPSAAGSISSETAGSDAFKVVLVAAAFGMLAVFPALLAQVWGARRLAAPTAALLTMSEIVVAIISAALLIGTDLPVASLAGGCIIILAVSLDIYTQHQSMKRGRVVDPH